MLKFIRTVDKSLEDFLILDLKTLGNLFDNVNEFMSTEVKSLVTILIL